MAEPVYIINVSPENWPACQRDSIFGIPENDDFRPRLRKGTLVLVRLAQVSPCGCIAVWEFEEDRLLLPNMRQGPTPLVPWTDTTYRMRLQFRPLAAPFTEPLNEGFHGLAGFAEDLGWEPQRFKGSFMQLTGEEAQRYVGLLLRQKSDELPKDLVERLSRIAGVAV